MFHKPMLALIVLFAVPNFTPAAPPAASSPAKRAIRSAKRSLELALAKAGAASDRELLRAAIAALESVSATTEKPQNELLLDFSDHPENYKGKTLTFEMFPPSRSKFGLREAAWAGGGCPFEAYAPKGRNKAVILINYEGISDQIPNARAGDKLIVTFVCGAGDTRSGNKAVSISRAK